MRERKDAWSICRKSVTYFDRSARLKEIRAAGDLGLANFSACQAVLRRLEKTFKAFFAKFKRGEKAGFPRFKGEHGFNSFTYPSYGNGCKLKENGKLYLQGVGDLRTKLHRALLGKIKTVTVKRENEKWYFFFTCETQIQGLPETGEMVGIVVGIKEFATLSNGEQINNPKWFEASAIKLRVLQRNIAHKKK